LRSYQAFLMAWMALKPEELSHPAITLEFSRRWSNGTAKAGSDCGCFTSSGLISMASHWEPYGRTAGSAHATFRC
jgi:hypothetical protein